jgi:hydroxymethylpyrimidine pyrophosphatase-like HAD family hydrolase
MQSGKIKLLALDLDGTLAVINSPISDETILLLKQIAAKGVALAILSGKPTAYLTGLARQIGIKEIILSGENGAEVQFGLSYPPQAFYQLSESRPNYAQLFDYLTNRYQNKIWIQPNNVNFSVFASPMILQEIYLIFSDYLKQKNNLTLYLHADCVELVDKSISKANALNFMLQHLELKSANVCAIGDGENDIEMLQQAAVRVSIKKQLPVENLQVFDSIEMALMIFIEKHL